MSKFLGFLLGIAVALVGPAMFGVLAADGGIKLNAKEMALAYGIGALIFWTVASYFSGAAALGAALTFGAMIYTVHWIPNRMTNFLNDVPGVTTGMIDGIKQYTLNGVVPILAVISLVYGIQLIVQSVQKRRRERAEADRLQREQEAAVQAQQMPQPVAAYPVAGGDYQPDDRFGSNFGNSNYDDLFEEEPAPITPRNQADEQTAQFAPATTAMEYSEADDRDETRESESDGADETMLVPTDADETVMVPTDEEAATQQVPVDEPTAPQTDESQGEAQSQAGRAEEAAAQPVPVPEPEAPKPVAPRVAGGEPEGGTPQAGGPQSGVAPASTSQVRVPEGPSTPGIAPQTDAPEETATQAMPVAEPQAPKPAAPQGGGAQAVAPQAETADEARPQMPVTEPGASQVEDGGEATQAMPVAEPQAPKPAAPQAGLQRKEEMGQQYRERMDPPDVDDTGEFFVGAFENPGEQAAPRMELPGQFRPA